MEETKPIRLSKAATEFNIGISTILEFLAKKGIKIESNPNTKLSPEAYQLLAKEFLQEKQVKEEAKKIGLHFSGHETVTLEDRKAREKIIEQEAEDIIIKKVSIDYERRQTELKAKQAATPSTPPKAGKEIPKPAGTETKEAPAQKDKEPVADVSVSTEQPVPENKEKKPKQTKKAEEESPVAPEPVSIEPESPKVEKPKFKVLGKIELPVAEKKTGKKKGKGKEEKPKEETGRKAKSKKSAKEEEQPTLAPVSLPEPEAETPPAVPEASQPQEEIQEHEKQPTRTTVYFDNTVVPEDRFLKRETIKLEGPVIVGSMELPEVRKPEKKKPVASSSDEDVKGKKKKRKRIKKQSSDTSPVDKSEQQKERDRGFQKDRRQRKEIIKPEVSEEEIQKQIKETLARLSPTGKSKASKHRKMRRELASAHQQEKLDRIEEEKKIIKVTEFVTANELATMMNVQVTEVISTCMSLGMFVSINQRLDAETLTLVAEEFGYTVEFVSVDVVEAIQDKEDEEDPALLSERPPIVTVMGHVDHGKTKLLDYIRKTNVVAGEVGGITQHIGAYEVQLENRKKITFLDTPGHEAFTAMRARGANMTDVAIIVVAADDSVMPQTVEAINHAMAAGVPMVFAINKVDKPTANPNKIREDLSKMNILVEEWGGKYQCQEISAINGAGVTELLDKVLLEAEMKELKANYSRPAVGTVIETSLEKGRGKVAKVLVQNGTLKIGDIILAGSTYGRVKAMFNERNQAVKQAGPSTPVLMLGLNESPQAGDIFRILKEEREAKDIATKRLQLQREQGIRTQKHITLDEIGRRIAIGDFKELNLIIKGDVDGSVEALSDAMLKLSTPEVQVNVIHRTVGQITESDVMLASASNAIIIGFQVRPSLSARKLAEQEQIDIRLYSIIYNAIEEIRSAIEGMLAPEIEEKITSNIEVREVFKITKVGNIAGCMVLDGKINRSTKVRLIRDGIVVYTGTLSSLKRFKDDVKEVISGQECGISIQNFNDIKVGDIIEGYEEFEKKRKL
ncbi:MAG: translation initiation factor IF-2 [Bacteroidetes bacterium]|nr:translation initiation factor IF-2 [Bacteroidota bacterium]